MWDSHAANCDVAHATRIGVVRDTLFLWCDVGHTLHAKVVCATSRPDCDVCHIARCV